MKIDDVVYVPLAFVPDVVIPHIHQCPLRDWSNGMYPFYTKDLHRSGQFYFVDENGYLMLETHTNMRLDTNDEGRTIFTFDRHKEPLRFHSLKYLYCFFTDKRCTLELTFDNGILRYINPSIRKCKR